MNSFRVLDQHRVGRIIAAAALLFAAATPTMVSAAQLNTRSIQLSSSSVSATGVSYKVTFTAPTAAGAITLKFCSNSPLISDGCTAPTGFTSASAATASSGYAVSAAAANSVIVTKTIAASDTVTFDLTGITNPSAAGPLYGRIATYTDASSATTDLSGMAAGKDEGAVAMSITPTIGVSGAVLESMTFCVSGAAITADCAATTAPTLKLGETVGSTIALVPGLISTGSIYTQISTNAASGAVVSLKSNALNCGGLLRAGGGAACDIAPALAAGIATGDSKFGVKTATATNTGTSPSGTLQPFTAGNYNNSTFAMNYAAGNATGVTSVYGDPFLDTAGAQVNNKNMQLTFGATINNQTPAGLYSADLSLIATGTF